MEYSIGISKVKSFPWFSQVLKQDFCQVIPFLMQYSFTLNVFQRFVSFYLIILLGFICSRFKFTDQKGNYFKDSSENKYLKWSFAFSLLKLKLVTDYNVSSLLFIYTYNFFPFLISLIIITILLAILTRCILKIHLSFEFFFEVMFSLYPYTFTIIGIPLLTSIWGPSYNFNVYVSTSILMLCLTLFAFIKFVCGCLELENDQLCKIWESSTITHFLFSLVLVVVLFIYAKEIKFFTTLGEILGNGAIFFSLFIIGAQIDKNKLKSSYLLLVIYLVIKFLFHPGLSLLFAYAFNFPNDLIRTVVMISLIPPVCRIMYFEKNTKQFITFTFWNIVFYVPVLFLWFSFLDSCNFFPDSIATISWR